MGPAIHALTNSRVSVAVCAPPFGQSEGSWIVTNTNSYPAIGCRYRRKLEAFQIG